MLTPIQISLVQGSFAQVTPIADAAAEMFYRRLFELDPTLSRLFKGDMKQQGKKLMQMIGAAVRGLDDLAKRVPVVQQLGVRHNGYGVRPEHYATVGAALLWTLKKGLGADDAGGRSNRARCAPPGRLSTACLPTRCRPPHATRHGPQSPASPAGRRNRPSRHPPHQPLCRIPGEPS